MKKILMFLMLGMFLISLASADYLPHKQNTNLDFSITSNFATSCNLTTINTPTGTINIGQNIVGSNTFTFSVSSNNYSSLGTYCHNIVCTDGTDTTTGEVCREVTPSGQSGSSNIVFFIFIILMIYGITFAGFFGKNIPITILGGMAMMFLGIYLVSQGVIIFRDNITTYFSYLTIGLGVITSFWALLEQFDLI